MIEYALGYRNVHPFCLKNNPDAIFWFQLETDAGNVVEVHYGATS
jgi:hypothetical protein